MKDLMLILVLLGLISIGWVFGANSHSVPLLEPERGTGTLLPVLRKATWAIDEEELGRLEIRCQQLSLTGRRFGNLRSGVGSQLEGVQPRLVGKYLDGFTFRIEARELVIDSAKGLLLHDVSAHLGSKKYLVKRARLDFVAREFTIEKGGRVLGIGGGPIGAKTITLH